MVPGMETSGTFQTVSIIVLQAYLNIHNDAIAVNVTWG